MFLSSEQRCLIQKLESYKEQKEKGPHAGWKTDLPLREEPKFVKREIKLSDLSPMSWQNIYKYSDK